MEMAYVGIWTRVLTSLTQRKQMMMAMGLGMPVILISITTASMMSMTTARWRSILSKKIALVMRAETRVKMSTSSMGLRMVFSNGRSVAEIWRHGEYGLVEAEGLPPTRQHLFIETVPFDLTDARQPRIYFDGRFDLIRNGFRVKVFSGDEALLDTLLLGPGHTGRVARAYEIPLDDAVGLDDVRVRLEFWTHNSVGHGVWIDNFRVDERPTLPPHVLPFSDDFDDLAHWGQFNGVWTTTGMGGAATLQRISRLKAARFRTVSFGAQAGRRPERCGASAA